MKSLFVFVLTTVLLVLAGEAEAQSLRDLLQPGDNSGVFVLPEDEASTQTFQATRERLAKHTETLRDFVLDDDDLDGLNLAVDAAVADIDRLAAQARVLMPPYAEEVHRHAARAKELTNRIGLNIAFDAYDQIEAQLLLLRGEIMRLSEITRFGLADVNDQAVPEAIYFPDDWLDQDVNPLDEVPVSYSLMDSKELLRNVDNFRGILDGNSAIRIEPGTETTARQVKQLARALVFRQGELPAPMRPGFRNAALQIEVIADNLADFAAERDRANFRRQLLSLRRAVERAREYVEMNERLEAAAQ